MPPLIYNESFLCAKKAPRFGGAFEVLERTTGLVMQSRAKSTVVRMAARLEHLEDLSRDELAELSRQARDLNRQALGEEATPDAGGKAYCDGQ